MVRMRNKGGYFTFRIISILSLANSWIRYKGGKAGIPVTETILRNNEEVSKELLESAVIDDIKDMINDNK